MRRRTQKLLRRGEQLRQRTHVSGVGLKGPQFSFDSSDRAVLDDVFTQLRGKWLLHNDGELELAGAAAVSTQQIREIAMEGQRRLAAASDARGPLREIEAAAARFVHRNHHIDRRDFTRPIDGDELDDLLELRMAIAEVVRDVLDSDELLTAQELFNFIETDRCPETPWLPPALKP